MGKLKSRISKADATGLGRICGYCSHLPELLCCFPFFFNFQGIEILRFILDLFIYCLITSYFSWGKGIH